MAATRDLTVRLLGDTSQLEQSTRKAGKSMSDLGAKLTRTLTPAAAAIGTAFGLAFREFDAGRDAIVAGTGASGDALKGLESTMKGVAGSVNADMGSVGSAVADLNTLTGATDDVLDEMTTSVLRASKALGEDGAANATAFGKALSQWQKDASEAPELMDGLAKLSQDFGVGLGELISQLTEYGPVLQNAGFSMEETAELMASLNSAGINFTRISPGLNKAFRDWAKAGKDPREELGRVIDRIRETESSTESLTIATDAFGAEGAQRMMTAIRNGAIPSLDELGGAMEGAEGTVQQMHDDTTSLSDRLQMLKNKVIGAVGPFGELGAVIGGAAASLGPLLFGLGQMGPALGKVAGAFRVLKAAMIGHPIMTFAVVAAGVATAIGLIGGSSDGSAQRVDDLARSMRDAESAADGLHSSITEFVTDSDEMRAIILEAGVSTDDMSDAMLAGGDEAEAMAQRIEAAAKEMGLSGTAAGMAGDAIRDLAAETAAASDKNRELAEVQGDLTEAERAHADAIAESNAGRADAIRGTDDQTEATDDSAGSARDAALQMDALRAETSGAEQAADAAAKAFDEEKEALEEAAAAAKEHEDAVNDMVSAQRGAVDASFAHRDAQRDFRGEIDKVNDVLDDNEADLHDVAKALDDATLSAAEVADAQVRVAEKTAEANGETLTAKDRIDKWNGSMIDAAAQADGPLRESIINYIADVNDIPESKASEIQALIDEGKIDEAEQALEDASRTRESTVEAEADTAEAEGDLNYLARRRKTTITATTILQGGEPGSRPGSRKDGGPVPGGKNDAVPILAHGGEYVLDSGTVDAIKQGRKSAGAASGSGAPQSGSGSPAGRDAPLVNIEHAEFSNGIDEEAFAQRLNARLVVM